MKVLHTADWHIGQFKGPVEDGVNLRSLDTVKCLEYMVEKAREEHPDLVCISGDVFHQEQIGPVRYSDEMVTARIMWMIWGGNREKKNCPPESPLPRGMRSPHKVCCLR